MGRSHERLVTRRGASAVELALVLPLLVVLVTATLDYGWYFLQESFVTNALRDAIRAGSFQSPAAEEAPGDCAACGTRTAAVAVAGLSALGIEVEASQVTPVVEELAGTCALVLEPTIPHAALIGLVPTPRTYGVRLVAYAQNVTGC
jgi:Flp pilus assembly protein TadG